MDTINKDTLKGNNTITYPNNLVEIAMKRFVPEQIRLYSGSINSMDKIKSYIEDYIDKKLIPSIKSDVYVYKPEKSYNELDYYELNDDCIKLFSNDLKKYIWKRIIII